MRCPCILCRFLAGSRRRAGCRLLAATTAMALVLSGPVAPAGAAGDDERIMFRPPVDRTVSDPFRPPEGVVSGAGAPRRVTVGRSRGTRMLAV